MPQLQPPYVARVCGSTVATVATVARRFAEVREMADPRRLRSKHLRYLLYRQADGRCSICRRELPPDWHADHVVPYRATGRTRVGEMQALCPECNLRKGAKMADLFTPPFRLRPFQRRFLTICDEICRGSPVRSVIAAVTPGGGKSALPVILAANKP